MIYTVVVLQYLFGDDAGVLRERNFQMLLLISVMAPLGNALLSPILDSLITPLGASVVSIGLIISVFWMPSLVVIPVTGILADRYGRKPVLAPSLVLFGLPGALIALTTEFWMTLGLRLIQGIGWAGLSALTVTSIGDMFVDSKKDTAQGLRQSVSGLAGAAGSVFAGVLVIIAWQFPFLLYGLALPVAVAVYAWFDEPTTIDSTFVTDGGDDERYGWALLRQAVQWRVFLILVARSLLLVVFIGFLTYNSVIVVRLLGGSPALAGGLYGLFSVTYAVVASQIGRLTSLVGSRYRALLGANCCLGGGLSIVFLAPTLLVAVLGVALIGVGFGLASPLYRSLITGFAPESLRAGLVSVGATGSRVAGVVTPVAIGGTIATLTPIFGFAAAVQLAGLAAALLGGGGGIVCVLGATVSAPVRTGPLSPE